MFGRPKRAGHRAAPIYDGARALRKIAERAAKPALPNPAVPTRGPRSSPRQEEVAGKNGTVAAILGGEDPRQVLSAGLAAMPADSNGNPFNGSWVVATGNLGSVREAEPMGDIPKLALAEAV